MPLIVINYTTILKIMTCKKGRSKCSTCKKKKMKRRPVGAYRKQKKRRMSDNSRQMITGPVSRGRIPDGPAGIVTDFLDTKGKSILGKRVRKKRG